MPSGGLRENAGRKKVGITINTRIEEQLIEQIDFYIKGLSRADKIRKCLQLGLEYNKNNSKKVSCEINSNTVSRFYKTYVKLLSLIDDTESNNIKIINEYLLGFFTSNVPMYGTMNISKFTHESILNELNKYSWSTDEYENLTNLITPSVIGSVIEKVVNQKETGSYYTPKDTTNYIAEYAIVFSLLCKCNSPALAYEFYTKFQDPTNVGVLNSSSNALETLANAINYLSDEDKIEVFKNIMTFTIVDPTCGTGAFIIAAADIMVRLYKLTNMYLYTSLNDFVINMFKNCLFGVDILPSAIALINLRSKLYLYNLGISKNIVDTLEFQFTSGDALAYNNHDEFNEKAFIWEKNFPNVFMNGGFDCIIGNPPYVESSKLGNSIKAYEKYKTKKCGNVYAYILERSLSILKNNSYMGMIVPISIVSTQRMEPLRQLLYDNCESIYVANFSDRPSCLFAGVHQKLSIIFIKKTRPINGCKIYSSSYNHWAKQERQNLFKNIKYYRTTKFFINNYGIAKIGNGLKINILKKIAEKPFSFDSIIDIKSNNNIYINQRMTFWAKCFTNPEPSKEYKKYSICDEINNKAIAALINSSLFYLLWETYSDCWHITQKDLTNLRFDDFLLKKENQEILAKLEDKLEKKLYDTREYIYSKQTDYIYVHRKCYPEIEEIDNAVAKIFGFTEEESNYIRQYNLSYRLSNISDTEE